MHQYLKQIELKDFFEVGLHDFWRLLYRRKQHLANEQILSAFDYRISEINGPGRVTSRHAMTGMQKVKKWKIPVLNTVFYQFIESFPEHVFHDLCHNVRTTLCSPSGFQGNTFFLVCQSHSAFQCPGRFGFPQMR